MPIADKFDLIVIGGGPAGCIAAKTASQLGIKTILLEKDRDFGVPVRCAEALVEVEELGDFIPPNPKWIDNTGNKVRLVAPDNTAIPMFMQEDWAILNRKVFDFELAKSAAEAGAAVRNRCCAAGLERVNGNLRVRYENYGKEYALQAPLVIGADGVESRVGRWANLRGSLPLLDIASCYQYTIHHHAVDDQCLEIYFGRNRAPGGYLWVFPKGGRVANIGLGILGTEAGGLSPKDYLDRFLAENYPRASRLSSAAGAVPVGKVPRNIAGEGVMLIGDAANQADPASGGGIMWGMWGGKLAAQTAAEALEKGDFSDKILNGYTKAWNAKIGKDHNRKYTAKKFGLKLTDDILNQTAAMLDKIPPSERTRSRITQAIIQNGAKLTMEIAKAFLSVK